MKTPKNNNDNPIVYIDPLTDFGFKRLFGTEPNKDLLIAFLNEVLEGRRQITDLVYNKQEHTGDTRYEGGVVFDLLCSGHDGEKFLIEVQRGKQEHFIERSLFYTSRLISEQAPRGKREYWSYDIAPIYLIALLDDFVLDNVPQNKYIHHIALLNENTGQKIYDGLSYTYIELRKFVKTDAQLESGLDRWLYVLKHMSNLDKIPAFLRKPVFEKLFNIAAYSNLTKEEKMLYDSTQKKRWDNQAVLDYAVSEAEKKKAIEIAKKMKVEGLPTPQIAKYTSLSEQEIEQL